MSWYALDALEDALDATRSFLLPFDARRWLALAVIAFFLGGSGGSGGSGTSSISSNVPVGPRYTATAPFDSPALPSLSTIAGLVAVGALLALAFALVGAVMRFVLLDALRTGEVRIRGRFGRWFGSGVRLFGFRLAVWVLAALPFVAAVGFVVLTGAWPLLLLVVPFAAAVGLVAAVVLFLTTDLVAPVMMATEVGVLAAWRRLWPTLRAEWRQFAVYALARIVLAIGVGIVVGTVLGALFVPLFAVVGVAGIDPFALLGGAASGLALVALGLVFLVALAVSALVQVPVQTYLGYFALFVLGDANSAFDLIPARRAEVRE